MLEKKQMKAYNPIAKNSLIIGFSVLGLVLAFIISLMLGTKNYSLVTVYQALFDYNSTLSSHQIIHDIRLPRTLAAMMIGAFLALSGCIMQVLTRNPLAEPSLLGVSHGAAFALVLSLAFFPNLSITGTTLACIVGAGVAVLFVFGLALLSKGGNNPVKLALAGVALGMFLSSLTSSIGLYKNVAKDMSFWFAGGLSSIDWNGVKMLVIFGIIGILFVIMISRALTVLHLGEDVSKGLGVHITVVRTLGILAVLLLTGSSVAVSGAIGFVGLVVPHICRMIIGTDYRLLLPFSAFFGGILLVLADVGAKFLNPPYETPVGVVTALLGVPFFLYLVRKGKGRSL
ncbi:MULTISPECIES: FecCD family ABC transporter permease [Bacillus]|uniref:FecCD family ABC transporter permease n=1 Tax=Bacillus TaxID=1386 RepID=UPI0002DE6391|nr:MULTISPECIES: iron ABC transporter permease [Bacillus]